LGLREMAVFCRADDKVSAGKIRNLGASADGIAGHFELNAGALKRVADED
jgi:hypothetical protein